MCRKSQVHPPDKNQTNPLEMGLHLTISFLYPQFTRSVHGRKHEFVVPTSS